MEMTYPVRIASDTASGSSTLYLFALEIMPGTDDMLMPGSPMLEIYGVNIYAESVEYARRKLEVIQQQPMGEQIPD